MFGADTPAFQPGEEAPSFLVWDSSPRVGAGFCLRNQQTRLDKEDPAYAGNVSLDKVIGRFCVGSTA